MQPYKAKRSLTWKSFWPILIIVVIAGGLKVKSYLSQPDVPTATVPSVAHDQIVETPVVEPVAPSAPLPTGTPDAGLETPPADVPASPIEFNLAVPFASQAPFMIWDPYHEETCEEASILMTLEFYRGAKTVDPQFADDQYLKMTTLEESLSYGLSMTAEQTVDTIQKYSDFSARVVEDPTAEELKELLRKGYPIIVPAAGRELGNPFFTGEGPLYHMLVIRGYTKDGKFITNDPGTRHGENYSYNEGIFMSAIGDWNNGDPANGATRVVVIEPK
ncbi:MAG: C39 family peptidase [Patescibacteria group bacterium]|jgi:hypothetical protein